MKVALGILGGIFYLCSFDKAMKKNTACISFSEIFFLSFLRFLYTEKCWPDPLADIITHLRLCQTQKSLVFSF